GVATPGSVGMPATYTYFFKSQGLRLGTAMGMMAVIVVTDLLFYISMMPCAAIAMLFEVHLKSNTTSLLAVVLGLAAVGTVGLYVLIRRYRQIYNFLSRRLDRISWLAQRKYKLARMIVEFVQAFRLIGRMSWPQRFGLYFSAVGYWLPRYGILLALMPLLGKAVPSAYLFLVQGVLNLGGQMFILPGGGGGVDAGYVALMSPYLDRETLSLTLLVWRTYTFYWYLGIGGLVFLFKTGKAAHRLLLRKPAS
ncbi:MAG: lysylphosphatidylglycerol synthase domain-containing protein, partial [Deltaproteobacteria bacterium]